MNSRCILKKTENVLVNECASRVSVYDAVVRKERKNGMSFVVEIFGIYVERYNICLCEIVTAI